MKNKRKKGETIYYSDPLNDDFNLIIDKHPPIPENYKYKRENFFFCFLSNCFYYGIAQPLLSVFLIFNRVKIKGRKNIRKQKEGAFIYANHTKWFDAFTIQSYATPLGRRVNILGYSDSLSYPVAKSLVRSLGFIPVGETLKDLRKLNDAIDFYIKKKQFILIYPEAHVWPYYTKIRPFKSASFTYPARLNKPIIPVTTTWRKGLFGKPRATIHIGEAIYPKEGLSVIEQKQYLRDCCFEKMEKVSNTYKQYEYFNYQYKEN